jgi:MFS transporter, PHS family, inorganic phosphate transporter
MLAIAYWDGQIPPSQELAINQATLIGTLLGQVTFGVLADRYGRKRLYGFELLVVIFATVGMALCSKGALNTVNILAWIISWRIIMGFGIGGDYPLSAVIVSELVVKRRVFVFLITKSTDGDSTDSHPQNPGLVCLQQYSSCNLSDNCLVT